MKHWSSFIPVVVKTFTLRNPRDMDPPMGYFGTLFPHLLFMVYLHLIPPKAGPVEPVPRQTRGTDA